MESLRAFASIDEKGMIKEVNQDYCTLLGYSEEELIGKTIDEIRRPGFPEIIVESIRENLRSGNAYTGYTQEVHKDGQTVSLVMSLIPQFVNGVYTGYRVTKRLADPDVSFH